MFKCVSHNIPGISIRCQVTNQAPSSNFEFPAFQEQTMLDTIQEVIRAVKNGEIVVVIDDENREDEGDLVMAAEKVTAESVNFMVKYGRGLICAPITAERASQLGLGRMATTQDRYNTAFTASLDAKEGITTGISANDRAVTISCLADPRLGRSHFDVPGHIFPLIAESGGVVVRPGHTEAAVDLARMAHCEPTGVICEIMNDDGTMARRPDLRKFVKQHQLKCCTIAELVRYRQKTERLIQKTGSVKLPTRFNDTELDLHCYVSKIDGREHIALVHGNVEQGHDVLVRVHSECLTGDVFHSARCDCGDQLEFALRKISEEEKGIVVYLRQEGRGIGLIKKIQAYHLQEQLGLDTVDANVELGFPPDLREYSIAAQILKDLKVGSIKLLTNNPNKLTGIREFGLEVTSRVPIIVPPRVHNKHYLKTKKDRLGHLL